MFSYGCVPMAVVPVIALPVASSSAVAFNPLRSNVCLCRVQEWKACAEGLAEENNFLWGKLEHLRDNVLKLAAHLVNKKAETATGPDDFHW